MSIESRKRFVNLTATADLFPLDPLGQVARGFHRNACRDLSQEQSGEAAFIAMILHLALVSGRLTSLAESVEEWLVNNKRDL